jgi:hypothetical protein
MLTRKHFKALASILAEHANCAPDLDLCVQGIREDIASYCARENPNFDRARFMAACQGSENLPRQCTADDPCPSCRARQEMGK